MPLSVPSCLISISCSFLPLRLASLCSCSCRCVKQYYLSGLLSASGCPYWGVVVPLLAIAERVFNVFDSTRAGLLVSLTTAVLGPLIEVRRRCEAPSSIGGRATGLSLPRGRGCTCLDDIIYRCRILRTECRVLHTEHRWMVPSAAI